ncbi:MAG: adenylate/guanylate cyclase domain-containing protein [Thermoleophilia bacterium]|nr:adenylate/guanylate cyclase domain-containing protein [Thermoleophilia bacterium]
MTARVALAATGLAAPLVVLAIALLPRFDAATWENHPAHFWLVLAAAAVSVALGYAVSEAARRRRDARLFLVSLAFVAAAGFLGLHALATPGVLLGKNAGFELATPVGLVLAGALAAASSLEFGPARSRALVARSRLLLGALAALLAGWAVVSLAELPPLDGPVQGEQLDRWQVALAAAGVLAYGLAALAYLRVYRRRRAVFVFTVAVALALLAESMLVIAFAVNWHVSWWEWHVLMVLAFAFIAYSARREWHEERFSALYLDHVLRGARDVSVLFADLQGFTAFSERSDPATVTAMLNAYWERIVPMIEEEYGGEVHQLIGDAVMAVFNKDGERPEHALLAASAALALQREAAAVAAEHPGWPRFRVGVNSGEVAAAVVGAERGHRKHGVVGDTVNLAARLESEARPGEVVIGAGTYRRLPDGALVEPLPRLQVKGKQEPVDAYVLRALDGAREEAR